MEGEKNVRIFEKSWDLEKQMWICEMKKKEAMINLSFSSKSTGLKLLLIIIIVIITKLQLYNTYSKNRLSVYYTNKET